MTSENPHSDELPDELQQGLRDLFRSSRPIDAKVDQAILAEARQHLEQVNVEVVTAGQRRSWMSVAAVTLTAIAATGLFAVGISTFLVSRAPELATNSPAVRPTIAREDLDGNGKVDVLDAFMLARSIQNDRVQEELWDLNHDGQVDQSDVHQVAALAVKIHFVEPKG